MIRFNLETLLEERGKTRYWLAKQAGMSHQNITKMARSNAKGIRSESIEVFCQILECMPNDLLVIDYDQPEGK